MSAHYYLHRKTGGIYLYLTAEYVRQACAAGAQIGPVYVPPGTLGHHYTVTDDFPADTHVTFYVNAQTGQQWARPSAMFQDGRFALFEHPPELPNLQPA